MVELNGVAVWLFTELQLLCCIVSTVMSTLCYRLLCYIPSIRQRLVANYLAKRGVVSTGREQVQDALDETKAAFGKTPIR